ncbi:MAG: PA4642 family protein [Porticoccaceae bacterium]|nr:PA4642 family protein [Porticoccaceae bacterium]
MALRKDKQKVLGEVFDDERIRTFLDFKAPEGVDPDFHVMEKAYRGMKAENFSTFLEFFIETGRNLQATNPQGQTLLDIMSKHQHSSDYVNAFKALT